MPTNRTSPRSRFLTATLLVAALNLIGSCDTFNPFNPIAFVEVTTVSHVLASTGGGGGTTPTGGGGTTAQGGGTTNLSTAGILQNVNVDQQGQRVSGITTYTLDNPIVTLRNRSSAPEVRFKSVIVIFDLPGIQIPQKEFLNQFLLSAGTTAATGSTPTGTTGGGGTQITIPIITLYSEDILNAIFPNNSLPILRSGSAHVFLKGTDINDHEIVVEFTTPLSFLTNFITQTQASAGTTTPTTPTTTPTPLATTAPLPTVVPSPSPTPSR